MINPWTKNPALSLWLSGANAVFGAARGRAATEMHRQMTTASAEMHRQMTAAMTESTRQAINFWTGGAFSAPRSKRKTRR